MKNAINFGLFQLCWFACVLGAAHGRYWLGPAAILVVIALHLWMAKGERRREAMLIGVMGVLGPLTDSAYLSAGLLEYAGATVTDRVAPLWIAALWMDLAISLNYSLGWLRRRYWLSALLGAVVGPLSYWAGIRLGALAWGPEPALTVAALALVWAAAMPACLWLAVSLGAPDRSRKLGDASREQTTLKI